jgi:hypothetical protein
MNHYKGELLFREPIEEPEYENQLITVNNTCSNCIYYETYSAQKLNECRRHAPIIVVGLGTKWPHVESNEWCGDWELCND